ncbi:MAG: hypothetical protein GIKADHBN_00831 [Phycisphaerales bacterium]|nr:hypothetical protein [Phycisphaerales bacterium]MCK6477074.1 hypothetical protein [Phycisphaerales bacterium]
MSINVHEALLAAWTLMLAGCGLSFDVELHNTTADAVAFRLEDSWAEGEGRGAWLSRTLAPGGDFSYSVRDGQRSDAKYVMVLPAHGGADDRREQAAEYRLDTSGTNRLYIVRSATGLHLEER